MKHYGVRDIVAALMEDIISKQMPRDTKLESPTVLAERYQVSQKSIHRALDQLKAKGVIYRVHGSGSYVKTNQRPNSRFHIGVFLFRFIRLENAVMDFVAYDQFTEKLASDLSSLGHTVEVFTSSLESHKALNILKNRLLLSRFDMLVLASGFRSKVESILRKSRIPVILFGDDVFTPGPWHQIFYDYIPGFLKAIDWFKLHRIRELYILGVEGLEVSQRRYAAVMEAARLCAFPENRIHRIFCPETELGMPVLTGQQCGKKYLETHRKYDGILSLSDYVTVGFESMMRDHNLIRLRDYWLISYDNFATQTGKSYHDLAFSAITHPQALLETQLVRLVEELGRYEDIGSYHAYAIPATELVIRHC